MILCHIARNNSLRSLQNIKIPDLKKFIELNEQVASVIGTYPKAKVLGVALNTVKMSDNEALEIIKRLRKILDFLQPMLLGMEGTKFLINYYK